MVAVLEHHSQLNADKESNGKHSFYVNYYHTHALIKMVRCDEHLSTKLCEFL